jgi:DNA-binding MarR family transcriptional regulator
MLKRLETLGLITRTRSAVDERTMNVELTDAGIALREQALAIPPAVVARLGGDLNELEELHRALTRINNAAQAAGALDL